MPANSHRPDRRFALLSVIMLLLSAVACATFREPGDPPPPPPPHKVKSTNTRAHDDAHADSDPHRHRPANCHRHARNCTPHTHPYGAVFRLILTPASPYSLGYANSVIIGFCRL